MAKPSAWGHVSRRCVYCGKVGPRTVVMGGYAHKRCVQKPHKSVSGAVQARPAHCTYPHCKCNGPAWCGTLGVAPSDRTQQEGGR